jgi:hypothetical protein
MNTYLAEDYDDSVSVEEQTRVLGQRQVGILGVELVGDLDTILSVVGSSQLCEASETRADARVVVTIVSASAPRLSRTRVR